MNTAVLIPIKSFDLAKTRLAEALDEPTRAALARRMASTVITAAQGLDVYVVCDNEAVATFSAELGANIIWQPAQGLNHAVTEGREALRGDGFSRVIVAHADLPGARDLSWLKKPSSGDPSSGDHASHDVTIVTDRHGDGSNVLSLPTAGPFQFRYGPGSAQAHSDEAKRVGLTAQIVNDPELGWDIDTPEDLAMFNQAKVGPAL